ncbi:MAG: DUF1684 domain-containing protein [Bacteroidia bacterium]
MFAHLLMAAALLIGGAEPYKGYRKEILQARRKLDREFRQPQTSPLREAARDFTGLAYFEIDPAYYVEARLERTTDAQPFLMPTSNPQRPKQFVAYGRLHFTLHGQACTLTVYRNLTLTAARYADHLFLPFLDETSGFETYGGGRYLDLHTVAGDTMIIDFNRCYNPYCAYSDGWACPLPPAENALPLRIEAGMQTYREHERY